MTSGLDYLAAGGAGLAAGCINALAGGGSLISFPVLHFIGLPSLDANVTNIVALTPGYLSGSYSQRSDLEGQGTAVRRLGVAAGLGALAGSILLVTVAAKSFSTAVPFLILAACAVLGIQAPLRRWLDARRRHEDADPEAPVRRPRLEWLSVLLFSVYGGFFGAGLGIMLLAALAFFSTESLLRVNALKQVLSLVVSVVAAIFLSFTGHVSWGLAGVLALACVVGGFAGGKLVRRIPPGVLRILVICYGVAVAIRYWV